MRILKIVLTFIMVLSLSAVVCTQGKADPAKETSSATAAKTEPKEDDCLAIYKKGWQIFLAPYLSAWHESKLQQAGLSIWYDQNKYPLV